MRINNYNYQTIMRVKQELPSLQVGQNKEKFDH